MLIALDYLIDHKSLDKDSILMKMISARMAITTKEAGNLRWQALSYIKRHKLRKNPAIYQFLNSDDAWAMDFMYFYNDEGKVKYLLKIIDDRSRLDVGNAILDRATTAAAIEALEQAIKNTGRKPSAVKTDRGSQFKIKFSNCLKEKG
ncbi:MAG: transposase family protein, partial [Bacillota bacterium]|nr:transposase family protein [Bacillota bacterium]